MWDLSFWPPGVCLHWGVYQNLDMQFFRTWVFGHGFQDVWSWVFGDLEFALGVSKTQDLGNLGYGFQDVGSQLWGLDFHTRGFEDRNLKTFRTWFSGRGILIWDLDFTLTVSKTQTWKILGHGISFLGPENFKLGGSVTQDLEVFRTWISRRGIPPLGPGFHIRGFQDPNLETLRTWFSRCGTSALGSGFSHWGWWFPWPRTWKFFRTWFSRRGIPYLGPGFHIRGFQRSKPGNS
jgi:hypothetical protein